MHLWLLPRKYFIIETITFWNWEWLNDEKHVFSKFYYINKHVYFEKNFNHSKLRYTDPCNFLTKCALFSQQSTILLLRTQTFRIIGIYQSIRQRLLFHPQHRLDYSHDLLIFLIWALSWPSETGQIYSFRAFPGNCIEGIAWNFVCWCILTTFRNNWILVVLSWLSYFLRLGVGGFHISDALRRVLSSCHYLKLSINLLWIIGFCYRFKLVVLRYQPL